LGLAPLPVVEAKLGVLVPLSGMSLFVLEPQEFERDAFPAQFHVDDGPVGVGPAPRATLMPLVEEPL